MKLPQKIQRDKYSSGKEIIDAVNAIIDYLKDKDFEGGLEEQCPSCDKDSDFECMTCGKKPSTDTGNKKDWIDKACMYFADTCKRDKIPGHSIPRVDDFNAFREAINKFMPKPVEPVGLVENIIQEMRNKSVNFNFEGTDVILREVLSKYGVPKQEQLVPLDISKLSYEIFTKTGLDKMPDPYTNKFIIEQVLSKYGVSKQEEKTAMELQVIQREREQELIQAYEKGRKDAITPVTSTIEELAKEIRGYTRDKNQDKYATQVLDEWEEKLKKSLSSLSPIEKKLYNDKFIIDFVKQCNPNWEDDIKRYYSNVGILNMFIDQEGLRTRE